MSIRALGCRPLQVICLHITKFMFLPGAMKASRPTGCFIVRRAFPNSNSPNIFQRCPAPRPTTIILYSLKSPPSHLQFLITTTNF